MAKTMRQSRNSWDTQIPDREARYERRHPRFNKQNALGVYSDQESAFELVGYFKNTINDDGEFYE